MFIFPVIHSVDFSTASGVEASLLIAWYNSSGCFPFCRQPFAAGRTRSFVLFFSEEMSTPPLCVFIVSGLGNLTARCEAHDRQVFFCGLDDTVSSPSPPRRSVRKWR